jgi:hypothetical protein
MREFHLTTKDFFFGNAEAEAENEEEQGFSSFYRDFHNIESQLKQNHFILLGQKGVGKSAFIRACEKNESESNELYCQCIKPFDLNLERLIQNVDSEDSKHYDVINEWTILINLAKMILDSELAAYSLPVSSLRKFWSNNSNYAQITTLFPSSSEQNIKGGFGFKFKIFDVVFNRSNNSRFKKAEYYQLIPDLRDIIKKAFGCKSLNNKRFYLCMDDLDVHFSVDREEDKRRVLSLLRVTKEINLNVLDNSKAKVIIVVREEITDSLMGMDSDVNKLLNSYSNPLKWYTTKIDNNNEKGCLLRKFINVRISANFKKFNYPYDEEDAWLSLVNNDISVDYEYMTAFQYILSFTFYKPRNLVQLFKEIGTKDYEIPLDQNNVKQLINDYVLNNKGEVYDELAAFFHDRNSIDEYLVIMKDLSQYNIVTFEYLHSQMNLKNIPLSFLKTMLKLGHIVAINGKLEEMFPDESLTLDYQNYCYRVARFFKLFFHRICIA